MSKLYDVEHKLLFLLNNFRSKLPLNDVGNGEILIKHNEFGEAFDLICTQLYEYDISINDENVQLIREIALLMNIPDNKWEYVRKLNK